MADYSHIKSKVAGQTWSNADYEPGGGDVEITDEKLNWSAEAKVDDDGQIIRRKPKVRFGKLYDNFYLFYFVPKFQKSWLGLAYMVGVIHHTR